MQIKEGPAFGALIIGGGVGFLVYQKTNRPFLSLAIGSGVAIADYVILTWIKSLNRKTK